MRDSGWRARAEFGWWLLGIILVVRRAPGQVCVVMALLWLAFPASVCGVVPVLVGLPLLRIWAVVALLRSHDGPARFEAGCGDGGFVVVGRRSAFDAAGAKEVPRLVRCTSQWPYAELQVRPTLGQTVRDFEQAAEAVRVGVGATRIRVEPQGTRDVLVTFTLGDELRFSFAAAPRPSTPSLDSVAMGRREDGEIWRLPIGPHTLVSGCSGSGKGRCSGLSRSGLPLQSVRVECSCTGSTSRADGDLMGRKLSLRQPQTRPRLSSS